MFTGKFGTFYSVPCAYQNYILTWTFSALKQKTERKYVISIYAIPLSFTTSIQPRIHFSSAQIHFSSDEEHKLTCATADIPSSITWHVIGFHRHRDRYQYHLYYHHHHHHLCLLVRPTAPYLQPPSTPTLLFELYLTSSSYNLCSCTPAFLYLTLLPYAACFLGWFFCLPFFLSFSIMLIISGIFCWRIITIGVFFYLCYY
jgi:hypothetical protein